MGNTITIKVSEYSKTKYMAFLPEQLIEQLSIAVINGDKHIDVEETLINKLIDDTKAYELKSKRLNSCAKLNNKGIAYEESGDVTEAIKVYEKNIADEYPATHAYDRLIILYRKAKRYQDELRVLNLAVKVFSIENERRFNKAIADPKNAKHIANLQIAHETCTQCKGDDRWFIYVPYPVISYIEQIAKGEAKLK